MRLSILVLFAASAAIAAPVPKGEKPEELYFPVQVGAKWVMAIGRLTWTETVTKVQEKEGKYNVTVSREQGDATVEVAYEVSKDGVFRTSWAGMEEDKPRLFLKLPYKEGTTWTHERIQAGGRQNVVQTHTMGKQEEVEVPAGKYKAIRVESVVEFLDGPQKLTEWYAAGIGMIKMEFSDGAIELKEFTR